MLEDIKTYTGTPAEVNTKVQAYLTSHPKAKILSSAVTVSYPPGKDGKETKPVTTALVIVGKEF